MDTLTLKGLRFEARHGWHEKERQEGNLFEIDLVFRGSFREAGETDELDRAIDYQEAEKLVRGIIMEGESVKLLETLALRIGNALFDRFDNALELEVAVRKLNPPLPAATEYSEIRMEWKR